MTDVQLHLASSLSGTVPPTLLLRVSPLAMPQGQAQAKHTRKADRSPFSSSQAVETTESFYKGCRIDQGQERCNSRSVPTQQPLTALLSLPHPHPRARSTMGSPSVWQDLAPHGTDGHTGLNATSWSPMSALAKPDQT